MLWGEGRRSLLWCRPGLPPPSGAVSAVLLLWAVHWPSWSSEGPVWVGRWGRVSCSSESPRQEMSDTAALQLPALHSTGGRAGTVTTIYSTAPLGTQSDILESITGQVPTASYKPTCPKLGTFRLLKAALDSAALRIKLKGFPGGAVVESLPANAGDTGSSPGLGRSHVPRSNWAREP